MRAQASGGSEIGAGTAEIHRMPMGRELFADTV
jgi:hypothetical protein